MKTLMTALALSLGLIASLAPLNSAAQASPYRYNTPSGWTRTSEGAVESFANASQPNVQMMLMAPKPLAGDFSAQFASERATLEQFWGLRAATAQPLQSGKSPAGPYAAYFASYDSDGGPRYMAFMAVGQQGQFGMLVFVAASAAEFNSAASVAGQLFSGISVGR